MEKDERTTPAPGEDLRSELKRLEDLIKERETSFYRALKTLVLDAVDYFKGRREFPQAAVLGAIFAYLRPGIVLVVGALFGGAFAAAQVWLLHSQNQLIARQNQFLEAQTDATRLQAMSFLVSSIDPKDPVKSELAIAQLAERGRDAIPVLMRIAGNARHPELALLAIEVLAAQGHIHRPDEVRAVLQIIASAATTVPFNAEIERLRLDIEGEALDRHREPRSATDARLQADRARRAIASTVGSQAADYVRTLRGRCESATEFRAELAADVRRQPDQWVGAIVSIMQARLAGSAPLHPWITGMTGLQRMLERAASLSDGLFLADVRAFCEATSATPRTREDVDRGDFIREGRFDAERASRTVREWLGLLPATPRRSTPPPSPELDQRRGSRDGAPAPMPSNESATPERR